jgi:uncharacterized protein YdaU (DUF1376 family)
MNYFELYPGDYLRDTTRLSLVEHGAYLRLLMAYYAEEQPLPADEAELFVIVSAVSAADKAAVRKVASRFFPVGDDGLRRNGRADEEIEKAQRRIAISRENGSKGGRKKNPTGNPTGNPAGTQQGTRSGEALHTPHAIHHQEQKPSPSSSVAGQPARPPASLPKGDDDGPVPGEQDLPSWIPRPLWREFYRHRAVLRKPLSIPGQRQVVRRLVELSEAGHDIAASLRQTMAAGLVIPVTPKDPDHADVPASRKLSAVDQVAAKIRERREREHADNEPPFATLGHG